MDIQSHPLLSGAGVLYIVGIILSMVMFPSTCTMYDSDRRPVIKPNQAALLFSAFSLGYVDGTIRIAFNSIVGRAFTTQSVRGQRVRLYLKLVALSHKRPIIDREVNFLMGQPRWWAHLVKNSVAKIVV